MWNFTSLFPIHLHDVALYLIMNVRVNKENGIVKVSTGQ
jgi:hypothetical protein